MLYAGPESGIGTSANANVSQSNEIKYKTFVTPMPSAASALEVLAQLPAKAKTKTFTSGQPQVTSNTHRTTSGDGSSVSPAIRSRVQRSKDNDAKSNILNLRKHFVLKIKVLQQLETTVCIAWHISPKPLEVSSCECLPFTECCHCSMYKPSPKMSNSTKTKLARAVTIAARGKARPDDRSGHLHSRPPDFFQVFITPCEYQLGGENKDNLGAGVPWREVYCGEGNAAQVSSLVPMTTYRVKVVARYKTRTTQSKVYLHGEASPLAEVIFSLKE